MVEHAIINITNDRGRDRKSGECTIEIFTRIKHESKWAWATHSSPGKPTTIIWSSRKWSWRWICQELKIGRKRGSGQRVMSYGRVLKLLDEVEA